MLYFLFSRNMQKKIRERFFDYLLFKELNGLIGLR